eukprot:scaffold137649_cov19-Tisochrysis_lutea.AAC.1
MGTSSLCRTKISVPIVGLTFVKGRRTPDHTAADSCYLGLGVGRVTMRVPLHSLSWQQWSRAAAAAAAAELCAGQNKR